MCPAIQGQTSRKRRSFSQVTDIMCIIGARVEVDSHVQMRCSTPLQLHQPMAAQEAWRAPDVVEQASCEPMPVGLSWRNFSQRQLQREPFPVRSSGMIDCRNRVFRRAESRCSVIVAGASGAGEGAPRSRFAANRGGRSPSSRDNGIPQTAEGLASGTCARYSPSASGRRSLSCWPGAGDLSRVRSEAPLQPLHRWINLPP